MNQRAGRAAIWWQAFRYHFVPPSFLPAMLGGIIARTIENQFHFWSYFVTVIGVTINHIALNMTDDYYDYLNSVDQARAREKNPYAGGSGTLTSGLIKPVQMRNAFRLGYFITILLGIYLIATRTWMVLVFGTFGMGCAYFYTAPPIRYGYRGFGELSQLINFSFTIGIGSFFVQARSFSWEAFWALLPLGFMMFAMITINEIPDFQADRAGGKRNLVVIFGQTTAVWLYAISLGIAYLILIVTPLTGTTSFWTYFTLITLPWYFRAVKIVAQHYQDPAAMAPANLLTVRIHNLTGILLIVVYLIQDISKHGDFQPAVWSLVLLILLYFPVALPIFFNRKLF